MIELKGSPGLWGLTTQETSGGAIRGLMIDGFDFGIVLFAGGTAIEQNVVSGNIGVVNNGGGILIRSNGNFVRGNRIGTNAGGTAAWPNRHRCQRRRNVRDHWRKHRRGQEHRFRQYAEWRRVLFRPVDAGDHRIVEYCSG